VLQGIKLHPFVMFKCILVSLAPDSSRDDDAEAEHYLERCLSLYLVGAAVILKRVPHVMQQWELQNDACSIVNY
jgi:hypothetical protein